MKNHRDIEHGAVNLELLDATELKRRAAEDAVRDADFYALNTRPQPRKASDCVSHTYPCVPRKASDAAGFDPVSYLLTSKHARMRVGAQDGIDGLLIHPNESAASLVLSDEMQEISLEDEVAALADEPIRIFHVQAPAPWVEQVRVGKA